MNAKKPRNNAITGSDMRSVAAWASPSASVIPFLSLPVHAEASGPVERFVPDLASGG